MSDRERPKSSRVGVIGTYGHGNLGDEAVFVAFLQWAGKHAPEVEPVALCVNPEYIERTYGVPAQPVAARYAGTGQSPQPGALSPAQADAEPQRRDLLRASCRLAGRLWHLATQALTPLVKVLRPPWRVLKGFLIAVRFLPRQLRITRSLGGVIVLGGGQVHDFWDGPFGHPMTLCSWALACRIAGRPFAILSIGAIELRHRLSQRFVRATFQWSVYATVRDRGSALWVESFGVTRACPVYPDLAWGLDPVRIVECSTRRSGQALPIRPRNSVPRTVGVCPMAYRHPKLWASGDADGYARYIGSLAAFCNRLLEHGYEVVLFPTQIRMDLAAVRDVVERMPPDRAERVHVRTVDGIAELVRCLVSVDVVVASRFHGVLLSLRTGRPALSLAYQEKCNALLEALGEGQFGLDIHDFSAEDLWRRFERLCVHFGTYVERLTSRVEENHRMLDEQYRRYFAKVCRTRMGC